METIEGIVREMRKMGENYSKSESNDCRYVAYWLGTTFADRIEAAVWREREATCEKYSQAGNTAKMRKALEGVRDWLVVHNAYVDTEREIVNLNAALAEPLKNCEVGTVEE